MKHLNIKIKWYRFSIKWILPIFLASVFVSVMGVKYIRKAIYQNVYNNITELGAQITTQLNHTLLNQQRFVEMMANTIEDGNFKSEQQIFGHFNEYLDEYNFTRFVILDRNGNGITSDGYTVSNYPITEELFSHDSVYLSENRPSTISDKQINLYSAKIKLKGEDKILIAATNTSDYTKILLRKLFDGRGTIYLINNDGSVLIDSLGIINTDNVNLYSYLKKDKNSDKDEFEKIDVMANNIKNKIDGTFDINLNGDLYFINYSKLEINDWYVISLAPDSAIAKETLSFTELAIGICLLFNFVIVAVCIYIDASTQKRNMKLYTTAYIDPITKLGNQFYFRENSAAFLAKDIKDKYLISIDINKFKALNNIYGYDFCNDILKSFGNTLVSVLPKDNITCRLHSDVFTSLFTYDKNIRTLIDKILKSVTEITINNDKINLNASMGVYKIRPVDSDINKLLDKVYMARSKVKGLYDRNYYIFDEELEYKLIEEQKIESIMESAIKNKEFKVYYQPKVSTSDQKLVGAEALVRWQRGDMVIPPSKFIPLFEKNKFIVKLDLYMFEQVCKDIAEWKNKYSYVPTISINVSKEHFNRENFITTYVKIANKYGIDTNKLDLEITESATVDDKIDILNIVNKIKEQGFIVSIDDFGTGYSSLSMLQNIPVDIIKIDKVFIDKADLTSDRNIINYIVSISKHLNVETIVEGVETKEQFEYVKNIGCDMIQGYYFSKPIDKESFEEKLKNN